MLRKNFFIHPVCMCNSNFRKLIKKLSQLLPLKGTYFPLEVQMTCLLVPKYKTFLLKFRVQTPEYL